MLPKKGRKLPLWKGVLGGREIYARTIAELLRKEHGDSHRAIKQLMRQTDACERTVKHWLAGQHGPDTVYFLRLVVSSPVIRAFFLGLIESPLATPLTEAVDRISLARAREAYASGEIAGGDAAAQGLKTDPNHVRKSDPKNVPDHFAFNKRQRWFLNRITEGRCNAKEIATAWTVSLKTARRDIAALKEAGLINYIGSRRKGRYRRIRE
ncbi:DeoR family transcriptional regulator [Asticcacaulis sp. W401b]|uniref:DeoR family transcriptional regulator n=1 Tax=Asticcacaulis sp. W401b TaxID=3388666 RepID=UPI0039710BB6